MIIKELENLSDETITPEVAEEVMTLDLHQFMLDSGVDIDIVDETWPADDAEVYFWWSSNMDRYFVSASFEEMQKIAAYYSPFGDQTITQSLFRSAIVYLCIDNWVYENEAEEEYIEEEPDDEEPKGPSDWEIFKEKLPKLAKCLGCEYICTPQLQYFFIRRNKRGDDAEGKYVTSFAVADIGNDIFNFRRWLHYSGGEFYQKFGNHIKGLLERAEWWADKNPNNWVWDDYSFLEYKFGENKYALVTEGWVKRQRGHYPKEIKEYCKAHLKEVC